MATTLAGVLSFPLGCPVREGAVELSAWVALYLGPCWEVAVLSSLPGAVLGAVLSSPWVLCPKAGPSGSQLAGGAPWTMAESGTGPC